jgi:hypothetical protein
MLLLAIALWFGSTENAFAYLDPGTGSILLQAVIGGVASGLFIVRMYWRKIKTLLGAGEAAEHSSTRDHHHR